MAGKRAQASVDSTIAALLASSRHPVIARRELLAAGLSDDQIDDRLASGRLLPVHRGVYAVGHPLLSNEARWMAATKACPGDSLSHANAGALWSFLSPPSGDVHLTTATRAGRRKRPGLRIHRVPLDSRDRTSRHAIPITTPARTLVDLAELLQPRQLERALDEARYLGLITDRSLVETLERNAGRTGAARLKAVLATHRPGTTRTRSGLEERFLALCRSDSLPRPEVNAEALRHGGRLRLAGALLAVETDSYGTHRGPASFERDHRRDLRLHAAGWTVRRFTDRQLAEEPELVLEVLRRDLS